MKLKAFDWQMAGKDCVNLCTGILLAELTAQACVVAFLYVQKVSRRKTSFYFSRLMTTLFFTCLSFAVATNAMGSTYHDLLHVYVAYLILKGTSMGLFQLVSQSIPT